MTSFEFFGTLPEFFIDMHLVPAHAARKSSYLADNEFGCRLPVNPVDLVVDSSNFHVI